MNNKDAWGERIWKRETEEKEEEEETKKERKKESERQFEGEESEMELSKIEKGRQWKQVVIELGKRKDGRVGGEGRCSRKRTGGMDGAEEKDERRGRKGLEGRAYGGTGR